MKPTVGIDLGTTNSCVATVDDQGRPLIVHNQQGESTTPSVVSFREVDGESPEAFVGARAARMAVKNPRNTVFAFKRLIGRRFEDPEVQELAASLPYAVEPAPNGDAWIDAAGELHSPVELSAVLLEELRRVADSHFTEPIEQAIITVPAYFGGEQRRATVVAAELAGLRVMRLVNEPTAAALGYGAHRSGHRRFAVCDLGGGTFDVSVVNVDSGVVEVISTHGNLFLGGDDFDRAILDHLVSEIRRDHGVEVVLDATAIQRLRDAAQSVKHTLSSSTRADIAVPYLIETDSGPLNFERTVRRGELEMWTDAVADRLEAPCREAIARCGMTMRDVDAIVLVGGMTRMPLVQTKLSRIFGRPPLKVVNPDEIVAVGAATQCAILDGSVREVVLLDVTAQALSIASTEGALQQVIPKNATIPTREQRVVVASSGSGPTVFDVFEGDAPRRDANRLIGRYAVDERRTESDLALVVELTVNVDGILRVAARELGSTVPLPLRLLAGAGLRAVPRAVETREVSG